MSKLGKREVWPKIKPAINHGKPVYVVDARIAGKRERRFFETKDEAEGWASVQRVRRKNQGDRAFDDSELSVYGLSVADAVKFTLDYYRRQAGSAPVDEVVRQLLASEQRAGRNPTSTFSTLISAS